MSSVWIDSSSSTRRIVEGAGHRRGREGRRPRRAYYSPAMEAARPRTRGRRLRRGTVERPLNARLVRVGFVVVVPALLAFLFSISTTGTLPRSPLEPLFDGANAATLARTLSTEYPSRVPGSEGAAQATRWYAETIGALGLTTEEDTWTEDLADLGRVELRNVVTVVPGRSEETIVVVAHRDNAGHGSAARGQRLGNRSSDRACPRVRAAGGRAGSVASAHARVRLHRRRVVRRSRRRALRGDLTAGAVRHRGCRARRARRTAVGRGSRSPATSPVSPARALVRTAAVRSRRRRGVAAALPSVPAQLVDLGVPFAGGEQGRLLGHEIAAITLTTADRGDPAIPVGDPAATLGVQQSRSARACDGGTPQLARRERRGRVPHSRQPLLRRSRRKWVDRASRACCSPSFPSHSGSSTSSSAARRSLPFKPALRALRTRLGARARSAPYSWLWCAHRHCSPRAHRSLSHPSSTSSDEPPVIGLMLFAGAFMVAWLVLRRRSAVTTPPSAEERLAGLATALSVAGGVALALALTKPYALVFVLPSLYAWLWLPLEGRLWQRVLLFLLGLLGPVAALVVLANELGLVGRRCRLLRDRARHRRIRLVGDSAPRSSSGWRQRRRSVRSPSVATHRTPEAMSRPQPVAFVERSVALASRAAGTERPRLPAISPSPRGTWTSASADAARTIMCDSWPPIASRWTPSGSRCDGLARTRHDRDSDEAASRACRARSSVSAARAP